MKNDLTTSITSLLAILLLTFHFASDILRARPENPESGGSPLIVVPLLVLFLYATFFLAARRSGYIIMLICGLCAMLMPAVHVNGPTGFFTGHLGKGVPGDYFFVWTLYALGATGLFLVVLCIRGFAASRHSGV